MEAVLIPIVAIIAFFSAPVLIVAIIALTIRMLVSGNGRKKADLDEETLLIQEIHKGLSKMEARVEALETLLIERDHGRDGQ